MPKFEPTDYKIDCFFLINSSFGWYMFGGGDLDFVGSQNGLFETSLCNKSFRFVLDPN